MTKAVLFLNNYEPKGNYSFEHTAEQCVVARLLPVGFGLLVVLATVGAAALALDARPRHLGLPLGMAAVPLLTVVACIPFRPVSPALRAHEALRARNNAALSLKAENLRRELEGLDEQGMGSVEEAAERAQILVGLHEHTRAFVLLGDLADASCDDPWVHAQYLCYLAWLGDRPTAERFIQELAGQSGALEEAWAWIAPPYRDWLRRGGRALATSAP